VGFSLGLNELQILQLKVGNFKDASHELIKIIISVIQVLSLIYLKLYLELKFFQFQGIFSCHFYVTELLIFSFVLQKRKLILKDMVGVFICFLEILNDLFTTD